MIRLVLVCFGMLVAGNAAAAERNPENVNAPIQVYTCEKKVCKYSYNVAFGKKKFEFQCGSSPPKRPWTLECDADAKALSCSKATYRADAGLCHCINTAFNRKEATIEGDCTGRL